MDNTLLFNYSTIIMIADPKSTKTPIFQTTDAQVDKSYNEDILSNM